MAPVASSPTQHSLAIDGAIAQTVGHRRRTAEVPVRSQTNPVKIRCVQRVTSTAFCPSISVFSSHSHSTNADYTFFNLSQML